MCADARMLFRRVTSGEIPEGSSEKAADGAEPKGGTPAKVQDDCGDNGRREARADADSTEDDAVGFAALRDGKPALHELAGSRIHCGFAGSKGETHKDEDGNLVSD